MKNIILCISIKIINILDVIIIINITLVSLQQ